MKQTFTLALVLFIGFITTPATSQVVINEVYGGGGNSGATYKNDFIELYNNSSSAVSLAGWTVQYTSATVTGTVWQATNLTGSIPANGYYLVQQAAGTGGTINLPTPDATGTLAISATAGKVALVNSNTLLSGSCPLLPTRDVAIIDFVGFGTTAVCFEGTAPAPGTTNTTSIQRTPTGTDSNQNTTDFTTGSPSPTNSAGGAADVTPPTISSIIPSDDATGVNTSFSAVITFSEPISKGTGTVLLKKVSDNSIAQTFNVTTSSVAVSGATASISINSLLFNTAYYIEISAGAFKDASNNNFAGVLGASAWNFTTSVTPPEAVLGTTYDFNTCASPNLPDGFTSYSVTGSQVWGCTSFGLDATSSPAGGAPFGVQINGFDVTNIPNEDWLISPAYNLASTAFPLLSFYSRTAFNGAPLQLKVSTNYTGTGDPRLATWTDINGRFPKQTSDAWTQSSNINLSQFKQAGVYLAFVYHSTIDDGARWTLDNIIVANSATPPPASLSINTTDIQFNYAATGSNVIKTFTVTGNDITDGLNITSGTNFLVSADGTNFSSSITFTKAEANDITKTVHVQFSPVQANLNYTGTALITTSGLTDSITFKGTSIDPINTLEVVNWNIEWFGSTAFGPTNDAQQEQNVKTILQSIGADVYALSEVVDTARLGNIVRQLPGNYSYVVSNYGSHTNTTANPPSSLRDAQKLAFVYKTSLFSNISTMALLTQGINTAADVTSTSYNNWASGRYPFMMSADVTLNGITKNVKFVLIHAKANTSPTVESYNRRKAGSDELRNLFSTTYAADNVILLGDFNDDLDQTITAGITPPVSSYIAFVNDSVNFPALTLPLSRAGKKSTVGFSDMIDQVVVSNEMYAYYISNSANVLTDASSLVSNYSSTTTDHYPVFTRYAFEASLLPVTLLDFDAIKQISSVELTWKTAQEINNKEFIIEKSADAIEFLPIGKIAALGTPNAEKTYHFEDRYPHSGNNFYRLTQVDRDGKITISNTIKIAFENVVTMKVTPNPAYGLVKISLANFTGKINVQILTSTGQVVRQQLVPANALSALIDLNGLKSGLYLIKAENGNKIYTSTIMVR